MSEVVKAERNGGVFAITLDRPESLNAMNPALIVGLHERLKQAADPDVRVVTIRGTGRGFCAGGDIRYFAERAKQNQGVPSDMPDELHDMIETLRDLPKPVVAIVHGPCAGAGMSLMLACDLAIVGDGSTFTLAYTAIALSPDGSSSYFLPRHVGMKRATELFLSARGLTPAEMLELGLVNRVVADDELDAEADALVNELAEGPTLAYAKVKALLNVSFDNNLHDQLALETRYIVESSETEDFRAGIGAFLAKKTPAFSGK